MNSLEGFKDFDKVIRPFIPATNHGPRYTLPSIWVSWVIWQQMVSADFCGIFEISNRKFTATDFDTYEDALRWIAENCSIANLDNPVPRGFERPRYPRICYQRVFAEIQDL